MTTSASYYKLLLCFARISLLVTWTWGCLTEPRRLVETRLEWKQQVGKVKVQGRGKSRKTRWRRSISKERHVEALLVADTSMMTFHEDGDVETYILTIMNMVSALYRDASIGNTINVVVVRIILLEDEIAQVNSELSLITLICGKITTAD